MQDNISPEERLLRLIRRDTPKETHKDIQSFAKKEEKGPPKKKESTVSKEPLFSFSFGRINRLLISAALILGIYLIVDFITSHPERIEERILELRVEKVKDEKLESADEIAQEKQRESLSHYNEVVESRELFTASGVKTMQIRPTPTFMEMAAKLRLQGIISGDNPQAVIEDTKTKQVYFLSVGGRIGDIELKEILTGRVVLSYHGQEVELTL